MEIKLTDHVETRDHRKVRLHDVNVNNDRPIAGVITNPDGTEFACTWTKDGRYSTSPWASPEKCQGPMDLVIIPGKATCWLLAYRMPFEHSTASFATFIHRGEALDFLKNGKFCKFALKEVTVTEEESGDAVDAMVYSFKTPAELIATKTEEFKQGLWGLPCKTTRDFSGWAVFERDGFERDGPYRGVSRGQIYDSIGVAQAQIRKLDAEDRMLARRIPCRFVVYATWRE
jgi:hypothetical protein